METKPSNGNVPLFFCSSLFPRYDRHDDDEMFRCSFLGFLLLMSQMSSRVSLEFAFLLLDRVERRHISVPWIVGLDHCQQNDFDGFSFLSGDAKIQQNPVKPSKTRYN